MMYFTFIYRYSSPKLFVLKQVRIKLIKEEKREEELEVRKRDHSERSFFNSLSFLAEAKDTEYRWCVSAGTDSLLLYSVVLYSIMCGGLDMMCTLSL